MIISFKYAIHLEILDTIKLNLELQVALISSSEKILKEKEREWLWNS